MIEVSVFEKSGDSFLIEFGVLILLMTTSVIAYNLIQSLIFWSPDYYFLILMRFGEALGEITIPEWKDCYLNYEILKIFVAIIKEIVENVKKCDDAIKAIERAPQSG